MNDKSVNNTLNITKPHQRNDVFTKYSPGVPISMTLWLFMATYEGGSPVEE